MNKGRMKIYASSARSIQCCRALLAVSVSLFQCLGASEARAQTGFDGALLLRASPAFRSSQAELAEQQALAAQTRAGTAEWTWTIGQTQRREALATPQRSSDTEVVVERPLRLGGKRESASRLADVREHWAQARLNLAWRVQSRELLENWLAWQREHIQLRLLNEQLNLSRQELGLLKRRLQLGDAAEVDLLQLQSAAAMAETSLAQAQARVQVQSELLWRRHGLRLNPPSSPSTPDGDVASDVNRYMVEFAAGAAEDSSIDSSADTVTAALASQAPELRLAELERDMARATLRTEQAQESPDPVLGLRALNGRGGNERLWGVSLSFPIGGEGRRQASKAALARSEAAEAALEAASQLARSRAWQTLEQNRQSGIQLRLIERAHLALSEQAARSARAYQLGSGSLGEHLLARRQANEAAIQMTRAQLDVVDAAWRLALEAGLLWSRSQP